MFCADKLKAAQPGLNAGKGLIFVQRADVVNYSTDESRQIKPGRTCRHNVDRVGFRFSTPNGCIMKSQTSLADVLEFAGDFGSAGENIKSIVPDVVP